MLGELSQLRLEDLVGGVSLADGKDRSIDPVTDEITRKIANIGQKWLEGSEDKAVQHDLSKPAAS